MPEMTTTTTCTASETRAFFSLKAFLLLFDGGKVVLQCNSEDVSAVVERLEHRVQRVHERVGEDRI